MCLLDFFYWVNIMVSHAVICRQGKCFRVVTIQNFWNYFFSNWKVLSLNCRKSHVAYSLIKCLVLILGNAFFKMEWVHILSTLGEIIYNSKFLCVSPHVFYCIICLAFSLQVHCLSDTNFIVMILTH